MTIIQGCDAATIEGKYYVRHGYKPVLNIWHTHIKTLIRTTM